MKRTINKTVNLDLSSYDVNSFVILGLFVHQAKKEGWTKEEIELVTKKAKSKDYEHLCRTIKNHCEVKQQKISSEEIWEVLSQLGLHTHYLASKPIEDWDSYDRSNYKLLLIKSRKLMKMYGIYGSDVSQKDVDTVTSHPNFYFSKEEEATAVMQQLYADGVFSPGELHVLYRYKRP
ncbi:hypothetical protein [Winogradskyella luteola]|uniref:Uncharacterized protein n=1 Tax=Winogradskyella luteola TaxID=2828330 RepID=A0A9X1FAM1_9FLAO|nr:hypothetical protein [Winogradskyella luteola]MBV7270647.1 hypothetical protein [Winogradskyella luteola]